MSDKTPNAGDYEIASHFIETWNEGRVSDVAAFKRSYWNFVESGLRVRHPDWSGHDASRVARIMAPFPLRNRYAPR